MNIEKVANIDDLIDLPEDVKILSYNVKRLTAPGENYGSLMLGIEITTETAKEQKVMHLVAKMVPPNDYIQKLFNTKVTFRNEIAFYKHVVPLLRKFQKERGASEVISFCPQYYGSRLNLKNDDGEVDLHGALVLENLKVQNYKNLDRMVGMDLDAAKLVIIDLAHLHAVPIALKLHKPHVFTEQVRPHLHPWKPEAKFFMQLQRGVQDFSNATEELKPYADRIMKGLVKIVEPVEPREPWATIVHNDCWVNNTMIKLENGKAVNSKIIDFQISTYGSPVKDLIFFLFTSVKLDILREHFDDFLKLYYNEFVKILKELDCETEIFSFENFCKEIDIEAMNSEFGHITFMFYPILAHKGSVKDFDELTVEDMPSHEPTQLQIEKMIFVVDEFVKREWL